MRLKIKEHMTRPKKHGLGVAKNQGVGAAEKQFVAA